MKFYFTACVGADLTDFSEILRRRVARHQEMAAKTIAITKRPGTNFYGVELQKDHLISP
jgi:hypothetical protein